MNKKKIIIIISCVLVIGLLATGSYFWVFNPIKIEGSEVEVKTNDKEIVDDLKDAVKNKSKDLNLKGYKNKLPSKNYKDYRRVHIAYDVTYKSIFKMQNFSTIVKSFDLDDKRIIEADNETHGFCEGDASTGRDVKSELSGPIYTIYVKGMSEDEIKDFSMKIADSINLKIAYNMQWIGNKDMTIDKGKIKFKEYNVWDLNTGDIKTDKLN